MTDTKVKNEIDAQSGRFEFLKQTLTLGLVGLAGTAAIFTDADKIPVDPALIGASAAIGISLLALVGCSLMGMSVYANLLKAQSEDGDAAGYRKSLIAHSQVVFVCIMLLAVAFVAFASLQVLKSDRSEITVAEAIRISRISMTATGCDSTFQSVERNERVFKVTYLSSTCEGRFVVSVQGPDDVVSINPAN